MEIGEPLLDTKFKISETGELLIGGSRQCFINGKLSGDWLSTGDIVEVTEMGKFYWCDRLDDQVCDDYFKNSLFFFLIFSLFFSRFRIPEFLIYTFLYVVRFFHWLILQSVPFFQHICYFSAEN